MAALDRSRRGSEPPHYKDSRISGPTYRIENGRRTSPQRAAPRGRREQTGPSRAVLSVQRHLSSPRSTALPRRPPPAAPMIVPTVRSRPPSNSRPTSAPTAARRSVPWCHCRGGSGNGRPWSARCDHCATGVGVHNSGHNHHKGRDPWPASRALEPKAEDQQAPVPRG